MPYHFPSARVGTEGQDEDKLFTQLMMITLLNDILCDAEASMMPINTLLPSFQGSMSLDLLQSPSTRNNHHNRLVWSDKDILASNISMTHFPLMNLHDHVVRKLWTLLWIILDLI
jgi:hypothetical protein